MAAEDIAVAEEQAAAGQIGTLIELLSSSISLQIAFAILVVGLIVIATIYTKFRQWTRTKKFSYTKPILAEIVRRAVLPILALALISSINIYIQTFELFDDPAELLKEKLSAELTPEETFAKLLNSMNIIVIAFTVGHIITILLEKKEKLKLEKEDFKAWRDLNGFSDDEDDLFHKCYKWIPPKHPPEEIPEKEFQELLKTNEGISFLEKFTTSGGTRIGSYQKLVKDPFSEWKKSEYKKYEQYYNDCVTGENELGRPLLPGRTPDEIYEIDIWAEEKRASNYEPILAGSKPPGYAEKKREGLPKPFRNFIPLGFFLGAVLGVISWWGVDLFVLATASGGIAIGVGFALKETFENYFAYLMIRKDKIFVEGERIALASGYKGIVYKITSRVTFVRHPLNESVAIVPTRQLVTSEIINYTKEFAIVPATVEVGVSYLNDPKQVAAALMKVGTRALTEVVDSKGRHLAVQAKCPNLDENKSSCGCDKQFVLELEQPTVRFQKFNDSSLDFAVWVYVRDYGSQFKMETDMRMMIYEEFKRYDIRIPWPIRTVYQGDEKKEAEEISRVDDERKKLIDKYGIGDLLKGDGDSQ
ncbi:MscS mechanosensitive ion channel [Candidatus Nitrosarchaeum limnium SFB1]|jgi:small-conductance mechanosensitive channel|uniref:MscS mechanosensitive ion channel n=1 Tax=Candidatus Nitrosarchaeum limnium SFB1 TaxID=886738 RepID=F3KK78_9ARCH|nr:MscS mechanosensitive ion channel [Candidatus Nitrosarchaeum limnium SFB1]